MDIQTLIQTWPHELGDGPYGIKGSAFNGVKTYMEKHVPGGMKALLEQSKDENLTKFMNQPFLPSAFYDVFAIALLRYHAAKMLEIDYDQHVFDGAAHQFNLDINGVYKVLLRVVSPMKVISRVAAATNNYFNFAPAAVEKVDNNSAILFRTDFPEKLIAWYKPTARAYAHEAVRVTGGKVLHNEFSIEKTGNKQDEQDLVTVRLDIRWQ